MTSPVRKAVIPAAGLGTRFLPVTKSQPKEMLPVVDKPSIQYVVEEAVRGRPHRHPHHHRARQARDRGPLRPQLRARALPRADGQATSCSTEVQETSTTSPTSTTSARRDPLGLGHAVSVAREHVGDEPFAVLLGDDIMVDDAAAAPLDARRARARRPRRCSRCCEVTPEEISSYGCVEPDVVERRARARALDRREAEAGGRAVEPRGDRPLRVHAGDLRRARPHRAGRGRRAAAHRRDRPAARDRRPVLRPRSFTDGRYDIGQKVDFLRANIELALDRPDLGPELGRVPRELVDADSRDRRRRR